MTHFLESLSKHKMIITNKKLFRWKRNSSKYALDVEV